MFSVNNKKIQNDIKDYRYNHASFSSNFQHNKNSAFLAFITTGSYLRFEYNLRFFTNVLFWVSGYNLGLKHPANSCKQVAFAAGVQKEPKCCRALKVAKRH